MTRTPPKTRIGFTLIELLIVVAIIAILAAIAVPNFLQAQTRSKVSRTMADMRSVATALESYVVDNNNYPWGHGTWMFWDADGSGLGAALPEDAPLQVLTSPVVYITTLPPHVFNQDDSIDPEIRANLTFWYTEFDFRMARRAELGVTGPPDQGAWAWLPRWYERGWTSWVLFSYGPAASFADFSTFDEATYDPTNGTISAGGIFRGGPGGNNAL